MTAWFPKIVYATHQAVAEAAAIENLRLERDRLRAIVTDLADLPPLGEWCALCGWETNAPPSVRHAPGCLVGRARTAIKETPDA